MNLDGPALINDEALTNSGSVITVQPAVAGPRYVAYRGLETQHRSDDCNCCGEYFGGFGSLWETYCATGIGAGGQEPRVGRPHAIHVVALDVVQRIHPCSPVATGRP